MNREVLLYESLSGKSPIQDFIESLAPKEQQKILWGLKLIEDGFAFKEPYFKKIVNTEALWELRISFGGKAFRFFFFEWKNKIIIITNGLMKKDKKDQIKAIDSAKKYMNEFKERYHEDT